MDLSSLVFVAIIGVWAAYLVPHWLRRRDDLTQSNTSDRSSRGLRVLQRRSRKPRPDRAGHRSGDAVLTSPRVVVDADGEYLYIPAERQAVVSSSESSEPDVIWPTEEAVPEEVAADPVLPAADLPAPILPTSNVPVSSEDADSAPVPSAPKWSASASSAPASSTPEVEILEHPSDLEVAIGIARVAARRRARIMALLLVATVSTWVLASTSSVSAWVAAPASILLVLHILASRVAGLRSRETLMLLAVQVQSTELIQARPQRQFMPPARSADEVATDTPTRTPERVARRAAAVGAETWEPIPVPPPTYTLKPAVHRPEPAPLDLPAAAKGDAPAAVSRGALPRRAADIERILALESHLDELFEEPKVVNG